MKGNVFARVAIGAAVVLLVGGGILLAPAPVVVGTSTNGELTTHVYNMPPDQTLQVAGALATTKLSWRAARMDADAGQIHLTARSRMGLSPDEIVVSVHPKGEDAAVDIVSTAGMRGFDFGANAQHVRELQAAMDGQLPAGK